jgi:hypothetical protein
MALALEREPRGKRQWGRIVARAWDDETFRRRLLEEPAAVLCEEGIDVSPDMPVRVVEDEFAPQVDEGPCFWLPPSPDTEDLIADDLGLPPDAHRVTRSRSRTFTGSP